MHVATELRAARERRGFTQAQLARAAGTSQATLSAYESGARTPSVPTLERLLAACGARLAVALDGPGGARTPSRGELVRTGRTLEQVLALAEALPVRHGSHLRFPQLPA